MNAALDIPAVVQSKVLHTYEYKHKMPSIIVEKYLKSSSTDATRILTLEREVLFKPRLKV